MDVKGEEVLRFRKDRHSEWVIRNSLYWLSARCKWSLSESESEWLVSLEGADADTLYEIERLTNDYRLREIVMHKTGAVRDSIAQGVLLSIQQRVSE